MHVELSVIKLFLEYKHWQEYSDKLTAQDFPDDLQLLYRTLDSFHKTNDAGVNLQLQDLANLFFSNKPKDKEFYEQVFNNLETYTPLEQTVIELIKSLHRARVLQKLSIASYEVAEGKKPYDEVSTLLDTLKQLEEGQQEEEQEQFVTCDLEELINSTVKAPGLRWRLNVLNKSLGSLRKGDFGFIFARPETGKTTFLASEVSHMIHQTQGPILWLNNEEQGNKVMLRVYQAYFGVTLEQLYANIPAYKQRFNQETAGRFRLFDSAAISKSTVEKLCRNLNPALIVFDQIDKVQGFKADREDLLLGSIYQWGRGIAKDYCPVIGVCQADGTGEGVRWLTMGHVANAKTAKQAEADFILGIGKTHDPGWEAMRFLNISKNKLVGDQDSDPNMRHARMEVLIEPNIARYRDLNAQA